MRSVSTSSQFLKHFSHFNSLDPICPLAQSWALARENKEGGLQPPQQGTQKSLDTLSRLENHPKLSSILCEF